MKCLPLLLAVNSFAQIPPGASYNPQVYLNVDPQNNAHLVWASNGQGGEWNNRICKECLRLRNALVWNRVKSISHFDGSLHGIKDRYEGGK